MSGRQPTSASEPPLLAVRGLRVEYASGRHAPLLRAVDGVDLAIAPGETLGVVGESGSGKSTIGRAILGLAPIAAGSVVFAGDDITHAGGRQRRELSKELQVVFQDPYSSLNPTRTIRQTLAETLRVHGKLDRAAIDERVAEMLERVGMPSDTAHRYPGQFSGGQRQRIAIARALMARPRLVICDEPVSALDLSVQAQVLNLLHELQQELGLAYLFISHDLAVVRHISHRILVLYRGVVMEHGDAASVYRHPRHPYTRTLLDAAPVPDPEAQRRRRANRLGTGPTVAPPPHDACPFAGRCAYTKEICYAGRPRLEATPTGSVVACHRWTEIGDAADRPANGRAAGVARA